MEDWESKSGHVTHAMSITDLSRNVKEEFYHRILKFREEVQVRDKDLGVTNIKMYDLMRLPRKWR